MERILFNYNGFDYEIRCSVDFVPPNTAQPTGCFKLYEEELYILDHDNEKSNYIKITPFWREFLSINVDGFDSFIDKLLEMRSAEFRLLRSRED